MWQQDPLRYVGTLGPSASAVVFASATNSRWCLTNFSVAWSNVSGQAATFMMFEGGSATVSTIFFQFDVSNTFGAVNADFGEIGIMASDTNAALMIQTGTPVEGSFSAFFSGYRVGG